MPAQGSTSARKTIILASAVTSGSGKPMQGTHGALRMIELASARLCQEIARAISHPNNDSRESSVVACVDLWQAAWGVCDRPLPLGRLASIAKGLPFGVDVDLADIGPSIVFTPTFGRVLLNLLILAAEGLPQGGLIMLTGSQEDLFIRLAGMGAAWPAGFPLFVVDEAAAAAALEHESCLQAALTALLAHEAGVRLSLLIPPAVQPLAPILRLCG